VHYPAEFRVCPRDAAELVDARSSGPPDELVGQTLAGTYAITRVIGEGGMGRVYEARHLRIGGKRFAIKALHPEFARHAEVLQRFQREAEAAASIKSPYVVEVYDVLRTDDGRPFMVGELLQGRELADLINDVGRMDVHEAVRITRQICAGLAKAHSLGIIHRDMKPENVFLVGDPKTPNVKILDFGISKSGDKPGTQLTKTGVIMGTPSFMAPEQARGERVSHLCDVYAVGAILYMMLTGRRPFDKGDATATLTALLLEDPPRPRSLDPAIPASLEAIIQRAMAKKPEERHPSLDALSAELAPFERTTAIVAPARAPEPSRQLSVAEVGGMRRGLYRSGALALALGGGALATLLGALLRTARDGIRTTLGVGESAGILTVVLLLVVALVVLGVVHVRGVPSEEEARTESLSEALRLPAIIGVGIYGFGTLVVRFLEALVVRRAVGAAWPVWDIVLALAALSAAGVTYLLGRLDARR
jgi:serine/threonine-protein kinase